MADSDLLFKQPPVATPGDVNLIFGETGYVAATLSATLPGPTLEAHAIVIDVPLILGTVSATLPGPTLSATGTYNENVERPTCGHVRSRHQEADDLQTSMQGGHQDGAALQSSVEARHTEGEALQASAGGSHQQATALPTPVSGRHQEAAPLRTQASASHQDALRDRRFYVRGRHQEAIDLRATSGGRHQDTLRDRRGFVIAEHQEAIDLRTHLDSMFGVGLPVQHSYYPRHQEAKKPDAGRETPPVPPTPEPCYTPNPDLLFKFALGGVSPNLLFYCENHTNPPDGGTVVVPIKRVYIVINDVSLRRVSGNLLLPALSLNLSIDIDSWTWGFTAALPASALSDVEPVSGQPVELEASINGNAYRLLVESIRRDRSFPTSRISISGRGKNAILAAPYAPILTFANSIERSAQQLMADVLQFNGVSLGWDVDWQLTDWLVPAGVFNVRGTYIDGLNAIVGAAGAYLQPHPTANEIRALLRYPVAPWEWNTVTPDFELPAAVTTREGIEWLDKPNYNRVYVSGQSAGIVGRVTRGGTAGDLAAPMVTDPLITQAAAARQRGIAVLGDTGRQAKITLRLPVLAETGVIEPGSWVNYVDGGIERLGIVRSTNVEVAMPGVFQTLVVESHE